MESTLGLQRKVKNPPVGWTGGGGTGDEKETARGYMCDRQNGSVFPRQVCLRSLSLYCSVCCVLCSNRCDGPTAVGIDWYKMRRKNGRVRCKRNNAGAGRRSRTSGNDRLSGGWVRWEVEWGIISARVPDTSSCWPVDLSLSRSRSPFVSFTLDVVYARREGSVDRLEV